MEKIIWKILGLIVLAITSFGFIVPKLISAPSDLAVLLGIVLGLATVYIIVKTIIKLLKQ